MPRSTKQQAEANRDRVVAEAARLFREQGLNGIGVADLMAAAGLTHGGFYRHFASKEDLAVTAAELLAKDQAVQWCLAGEAARAEGRSGLDAILEGYLSEGHRDAMGRGCVVAALGAEFARLAPEARARVARGLGAMIDALAEQMSAGADAEGRDNAHERATFALSAMVGALVLARLSETPEAGTSLLRVVGDRLKRVGQLDE